MILKMKPEKATIFSHLFLTDKLSVAVSYNLSCITWTKMDKKQKSTYGKTSVSA